MKTNTKEKGRMEKRMEKSKDKRFKFSKMETKTKESVTKTRKLVQGLSQVKKIVHD